MTSDHTERREPKGAAPGMARPRASLAPDSRRRIGRHLRQLYAEILTEPLPPRFAALLDALSGPGPDTPSTPRFRRRPT